MLDPNSTKVLARRVLAAIIDAVLVSILGLLVIKNTALKFANNVDSFGTWSPSSADHERFSQLPLPPSLIRRQGIGDTMYVFGGYPFLLGLVFVALLVAAIYLLLPFFTGSSVGKRLTNLQVVDDSGERPSFVQHLKRFLLIPIDLFFGIGLLASMRDTFSRRIGDRIAGTAVVEGGKAKLVDPDAWQRKQDAIKTSAAKTSGIDLDSMIEIDSRIEDVPDAQQAGDKADPPAPTKETIAEPDLAPPIEIIGSMAPATLPAPEFEVPEFSGATTPTAASPDEDNWDRPTGTPAPVWSLPATPELAAEPPLSVGVETPVASKVEPLAVTPDETALPSDIGQLPERRPSSGLDQIALARATEVAEGAHPDSDNPIWNDGWNSWMYYDVKIGAWLRHDTEAGKWIVAE